MDNQLLELRPGKKEDESFLYGTWLNGTYQKTRWRTEFARGDFFKGYHSVIAHILSKPQTQILTCCLKEDPDILVGYSVFEKCPTDTIFHWIFIRADWRGNKIAKDLIPPKVTVVTHMTPAGQIIFHKFKVKPKLVLIPLSYEILETTV